MKLASEVTEKKNLHFVIFFPFPDPDRCAFSQDFFEKKPLWVVEKGEEDTYFLSWRERGDLSRNSSSIKKKKEWVWGGGGFIRKEKREILIAGASPSLPTRHQPTHTKAKIWENGMR